MLVPLAVKQGRPRGTEPQSPGLLAIVTQLRVDRELQVTGTMPVSALADRSRMDMEDIRVVEVTLPPEVVADVTV